ncbi:MAG: ABC transporter substrate-binding protein [Coriobacteriia bacterium]|nr:ABC transporter substrate-binding protein [Coriobacteriia bacterium]
MNSTTSSAADVSVSRRQLCKLFAAAGVFSMMGGIAASVAHPATALADGEYKDTVTFAQGAEPTSLDPAYFSDGDSRAVVREMCESMLRFAADSTDIEPCLAESWDISDDQLTYTFHLRKGVKFHNGEEMTSADVVASLGRQLEENRDTDMSYASFIFGDSDTQTGVSTIEAPDDYTVVFKLRSVNTTLIKNMALGLGAPILSKKALDEVGGRFTETLVGTGPYKFVSWTKADNLVLTRFDEYWDAEHAGKTQNIVYRFIAENASRVMALVNGEVDVITGVDSTVASTVTNSGYSLFEVDGLNINYMLFNCDQSIFTDASLRKAVCQAINVPELVKALYGDYATPANSVMPESMAPYVKDIKQPEYDPEAAQAALSAAGVTELHMITYSNPRPYNPATGQTLGEAIQGYLAKIGVNVTVDTYDWTTYKQRLNAHDFDLAFNGWSGDNGDPDNFMNLLADSFDGLNTAHFEDAEYKDLIKQGVELEDGEERDAIYKRCEEIVAEKVPWLVISHTKVLTGYSPKVQNMNYHIVDDVRIENLQVLA